MVAKELAKNLTEGDLLASIKFYSSPEGRNLGGANARMTEVMGEYVQKAVNSRTVELNNTTKKALEELIQEFKKNKK